MPQEHFSLRLPEELVRAVMNWRSKHSVAEFSEAIRELLRIALELTPPKEVVYRGVANLQELEALLGRCENLTYALKTIKLHLRKPLPNYDHDPELEALVNKWRAQSEQAIPRLEKIEADLNRSRLSILGLNEETAEALTLLRKLTNTDLRPLLESQKADPDNPQRNLWIRQLQLARDWLRQLGC